MKRDIAKKIPTFLASCKEPQAVETIRTEIGLSHWSMALAYCLELVTEGKIQGMKTSRGWIFWIPKENQPTITGGGINVPD